MGGGQWWRRKETPRRQERRAEEPPMLSSQGSVACSPDQPCLTAGVRTSQTGGEVWPWTPAASARHPDSLHCKPARPASVPGPVAEPQSPSLMWGAIPATPSRAPHSHLSGESSEIPGDGVHSGCMTSGIRLGPVRSGHSESKFLSLFCSKRPLSLTHALLCAGVPPDTARLQGGVSGQSKSCSVSWWAGPATTHPRFWETATVGQKLTLWRHRRLLLDHTGAWELRFVLWPLQLFLKDRPSSKEKNWPLVITVSLVKDKGWGGVVRTGVGAACFHWFPTPHSPDLLLRNILPRIGLSWPRPQQKWSFSYSLFSGIVMKWHQV